MLNAQPGIPTRDGVLHETSFGDAVLPLDMIDHAIEVDAPLTSPEQIVIDDAARVIAQRIAQRAPTAPYSKPASAPYPTPWTSR